MLFLSSTRLTSDGRPIRRPRRARRGALSAVLPMLLVLSILGAACVIDWGYLTLVNRDLQRKCDILALAGAPELLDDNLLCDRPAEPHDCLQHAAAAVDAYRRENNRVGGSLLHVDPSDVKVDAAFVSDARHDGLHHLHDSDDSQPSRTPNALFVGLTRLSEGSHPVRYLLDGFAGQPKEKADVAVGAWAMLDNLVVGFRPTTTVPAPLLPIAIDEDAWQAFRSHRNQGSDQFPHGGNGIRELMLELRGPKEKQSDSNAVLVDFAGSQGLFQPERLAEQLARGVFADELADGVLGPIGASGETVLCRARQTASEELSVQMAEWINHAVHEAELSGTVLKRALPLYRSLKQHGHEDEHSEADKPVELVGLVACSILGADSDPVQHRLTVWVEPTYLIHDTVWTVPLGAGAPERNLYLYRLRLIE